jgi:hypothetical protein
VTLDGKTALELRAAGRGVRLGAGERPAGMFMWKRVWAIKEMGLAIDG